MPKKTKDDSETILLDEQFLSVTPEETQKWAAAFSKLKHTLPQLVLLEGALGSGKTEWVKGFVKAVIGPMAHVSSQIGRAHV